MKIASRDKLPKKDFGEPGKRDFPMEDKKHDRLAIGGATRAYDAGNISKSTETRIQGEARRKLDDGRGKMGKAKSRGGSPHHVRY